MDAATASGEQRDSRAVPAQFATGFAMLCAIASVLIPSGEARWPPDFSIIRIVAWSLSVAAVALATLSSFLDSSLGNRIFCTMAAGLGLVGAWLPLSAFFWEHSTYPWIVVAGLAMLSVVAAWLARLRFLSVASALFLIYWFYGAFTPPTTSFPARQVRDGLECDLIAANVFRLTAKSGQDLTREIDLHDVSLEGNAGPLIGVRFWPPFPAQADTGGDFKFTTARPSYTLQSPIFQPDWIRSFDLRITAPRIEKASIASVVVHLDKRNENLQSGTAQKWLKVRDLGFGNSMNDPAVKCLRLELSSKGLLHDGRRNGFYRLTDDHGSPVEWSGAGSGWTNGEVESTGIEVFLDEALTKKLKVELVTDAPEPIVFSFGRIPAAHKG